MTTKLQIDLDLHPFNSSYDFFFDALASKAPRYFILCTEDLQDVRLDSVYYTDSNNSAVGSAY